MLVKQDVSDVVALVRSLQDFHDQKTFFHALLERLEVIFKSSSIVFIPFDRQKGAFCFEGHYSRHMSSSLLMEYVTYYHPMDPFVFTGWLSREGSCAATYGDFISREELLKTEFMRNFLSRVPLSDCLAIKLVYQGDLMGVIGVHRREDNGCFGEREREIAEVLCEHLSERLHQVLSWRQGMGSSDSEIGVLIVDAGNEVLYSNAVAKKVMFDLSSDPVSKLSQLGQEGGTVYFRTSYGSFRMRSFPMRTTSGIFCENKIANGAGARHVEEVHVILLEPFSTSTSLKNSLSSSGLTVRQQTVVSKVIQGFSNREIAKDLLISEQTVKDHLHDVFEKLRIRNRCELVLFFTEGC